MLACLLCHGATHVLHMLSTNKPMMQSDNIDTYHPCILRYAVICTQHRAEDTNGKLMGHHA